MPGDWCVCGRGNVCKVSLSALEAYLFTHTQRRSICTSVLLQLHGGYMKRYNMHGGYMKRYNMHGGGVLT